MVTAFFFFLFCVCELINGLDEVKGCLQFITTLALNNSSFRSHDVFAVYNLSFRQLSSPFELQDSLQCRVAHHLFFYCILFPRLREVTSNDYFPYITPELIIISIALYCRTTFHSGRWQEGDRS